MATQVVITRRAQKDIKKIPTHIADKLDEWIEAVETDGIQEVRKIPGYHDEPLKGNRQGQRSIRLSLSYRMIYEMNKKGVVEFVSVEEVNKHDY